MLVRLLEDLRFVIGLFFGIVSVILIAGGSSAEPNVVPLSLNFYSGIAMGLFSAIMLGMAFHFNSDPL